MRQVQLNATKCDNKIIHRRHLETISISHKKSRRQHYKKKQERRYILVICFPLSASSSSTLPNWRFGNETQMLPLLAKMGSVAP